MFRKTIFDGADETIALEHFAEIERVLKADRLGNLLDAQIGGFKQFGRLLDAFIIDIFLKGRIDILFKQGGEVAGRDKETPCDFACGERDFKEMLVNIVVNLLKQISAFMRLYLRRIFFGNRRK